MKEVGSFPAAIVDAKGKDNGVRFIDVDEDGNEDVILNNGKDAGIYLFDANKAILSKSRNPSDLPYCSQWHEQWGLVREETSLGTERKHKSITRRCRSSIFSRSTRQHRTRSKRPSAISKSIQVPEGFRVELVAAEPLVMDPIAIDWGVDGKLWVVEMADYPLGLDDQGKPGGRVRFLRTAMETDSMTSPRYSRWHRLSNRHHGVAGWCAHQRSPEYFLRRRS